MRLWGRLSAKWIAAKWAYENWRYGASSITRWSLHRRYPPAGLWDGLDWSGPWTRGHYFEDGWRYDDGFSDLVLDQMVGLKRDMRADMQRAVWGHTPAKQMTGLAGLAGATPLSLQIVPNPRKVP